MEFILLFVHPQDAGVDTSRWPWTGSLPAERSAEMAAMSEFAAELRREGTMKGGAPLHSIAEAAQVVVRGGGATVTDGPYAESKEVIAGFAVVEAASRAEAIEIARRCPHARWGVVEIRTAPDRDVVRADPAAPGARKYLLLLHQGLDESDPDGSKFREMVAFDEALKGEGRYLESSQLLDEPPPARVDARRGAPLVTDGPFAESREVAGGYYFVEAASREEAIDLARRCPHARWGRIEVREAMKVNPR